jgi:drug/metabolite transporter (DMT)-like permease
LLKSPILLLAFTGFLVGATFPLGKIAGQSGVPPAVWSFLISGGSASVLLTVLLVTGRSLGGSWRHLRYYALAGIVSYALPNLLVFSVIPHLGAGLTSLMFTLSPVATLGLSILFGLRRPTSLGIAGIAVGFAGAVLIVQSKGQVDSPAEPVWLAVALLIPMSLAIGNVYRTLDWPAGADGLSLAAATNLASALFLLMIGPALMGSFAVETLLDVGMLAAVQVACSALMFAVFFRLQVVGGPVYLSQIGYVAAAVGLGSGALLLGESYGVLTWAGAAVVAAGIVMTTLAQRQKQAS